MDPKSIKTIGSDSSLPTPPTVPILSNGLTSTPEWVGILCKESIFFCIVLYKKKKYFSLHNIHIYFNEIFKYYYENPRYYQKFIENLNYIFRTDVQFPYWNFPTGKLVEQCLGYYVAYVHNDHIIAKNCIKNNPFWMENSLSVIGEQNLPSIMIPGTHDSGSYDKWTKDSTHNCKLRIKNFPFGHSIVFEDSKNCLTRNRLYLW